MHTTNDMQLWTSGTVETIHKQSWKLSLSEAADQIGVETHRKGVKGVYYCVCSRDIINGPARIGDGIRVYTGKTKVVAVLHNFLLEQVNDRST